MGTAEVVAALGLERFLPKLVEADVDAAALARLSQVLPTNILHRLRLGDKADPEPETKLGFLPPPAVLLAAHPRVMCI